LRGGQAADCLAARLATHLRPDEQSRLIIALIISFFKTHSKLEISAMAKGQQNSGKMVKKPKKDTSPPKSVSPDAVRPTVVTQVPLRGKLKNK
jgi:hypothetical protein